jgi:outer membrane protein OmpA-like peptidoglycan-associated protein
VLALAAIAHAEPDPGRTGSPAGPTAGLYFGYLATNGQNPLAPATEVVARLGVSIVPAFDLELGGGYGTGSTRDFGYGYEIGSPQLDALFHITPNARFDLFIAIGAGADYVNVHRTSESDSAGFEDRALYRNPSSDFVMNAGPGLIIQIAGPLHLRNDVRWFGTFGKDAQVAKDDVYQNLEWTIGLDFRKEEPPDRDGDGIKNKDDDCPDDPEDRDDFEDEDGCPEPDNDRDGVKDERDDCPLDPEDRDDFEDKDGCPDPDNDDDGIRDTRDECPNDPEDADGWEDTDGCPDPDNDGDGIGDARDSCPDEPETENNFEDNDGCPDEIPVEVRKFTGVIEGIQFETNKTVIRKSSEPTLYRALEVLDEYADIRILVEGHTDDVGNDAFNLTLSEGRARSVCQWFVDHGINAERLQYVGFGETRPRAENDSDVGRAENRRVEFKLVE